MESYIFIIFNIAGGGLLAFFDDKLTTFRNKNDRFICNVNKNKIGFGSFEKDIGSTQNGHF